MDSQEPQEVKGRDGGREINRIRAQWLEEINHPRKVEMAFELEMSLKALDRFFNIQNLPLTEPEKAITMNFMEELRIVLEYVSRTIDLSRELLEASKGGQVFQFRSYVETSLLSDLGRTKIREASFEQKSPIESLFLLYTGFINIRGILRALVRVKRISYALFVNIGNLISREIIANRFFNPVREIEFRPEFDRIENRKISRVVVGIGEETLRRNFSMVLLVFFRLLKYLDHINPKTSRMEILRYGLPLFALIRSESVQLGEFLEKRLVNTLKEFKDGDEKERADLVTVTDSLSFQLSMELKKIYRGELLGVTRSHDAMALRGAVENSHGILTNFFQQSIIHIVKVFDTQIEGRDIFPFYTSKLRQSLQLRSDIWVYKELMDRFEEQAETNPEEDTKSIYIKYCRILKDYILYFKQESYNLLRYDDMIEFDKFFAFTDEIEVRDLKEPDKLNDFIYRVKFFKIFLEATLGNIEMRGELKNRPTDYRACERFLKEFILASMRKAALRLKAKRAAEEVPASGPASE